MIPLRFNRCFYCHSSPRSVEGGTCFSSFRKISSAFPERVFELSVLLNYFISKMSEALHNKEGGFSPWVDSFLLKKRPFWGGFLHVLP